MTGELDDLVRELRLDDLVENYRSLPCGPGPDDGTPLTQWSLARPLELDEAYRAQVAALGLVRRRWPGGLAGYKISTAPDPATGGEVARPIAYGRVPSEGVVRGSVTLPLDRLNVPVLEPEIQLRNRAALDPRMSVEEMSAYVEVTASLEIPISRVVGWWADDPAGRISLDAFIVDNAAAGMVVVGDTWRAAGELDLESASVVLSPAGADDMEGRGRRAAEHPVKALKWLVERLAETGQDFPAGLLISSGSLTPPVRGTRGTHTARFGGGLGAVSVTFT